MPQTRKCDSLLSLGMHRDGARRRLALLLSLALCAAVAGDGGGSGGDHGDTPTAVHDAPAQLPTPHLHAPVGGDGGGAPAKELPAEGEHGAKREGAPEDKPSDIPLHNPHVHTPVAPVDAGSGNGHDRPFVIEEVNMNDHALVAYSVPEDQVTTRTHSHTHTAMEPGWEKLPQHAQPPASDVWEEICIGGEIFHRRIHIDDYISTYIPAEERRRIRER